MNYICVAFIALLGLATAATDCTWTASGTSESFPLSASYDLTPLAGIDYTIMDSQASHVASRNFTYVFNVCGVVNNVPITKAGEGSVCYAQGSKDPVHYPAYQVSQSSDQCLRLGSDATKENTRWSLIDNTDPTVGINYMYINGDDMACPGPRSFWLELTCKDNEYNIPDEEPVFETNCVYKVSIDSIYGCPIECGLSRGLLCGKRGLCKFDLDTRKPHCYCQKGFTGYSCSDRGDNKAEGFTNTTFLLAGVLGMLVLVELATAT
ncbi:hypothetical protein WA577_005155 [Blastocystis sp. JDR]